MNKTINELQKNLEISQMDYTLPPISEDSDYLAWRRLMQMLDGQSSTNVERLRELLAEQFPKGFLRENERVRLTELNGKK